MINTFLKKFEENTEGTDYVVGDIHGCFKQLSACLVENNFNPSVDRLLSVGDLVDRGEESHEALVWLQFPWFHSVVGNHEKMAIDYSQGTYVPYYLQNGGGWIMDLPKEEVVKYGEAFSKLPYAIEVPCKGKRYGIVHADCPVRNWFDLSTTGLSEYQLEDYKESCIWSRNRISRGDKSTISNIDLVYVGHTPLKCVTMLGNVLYIDTGAVFKGGKMTVLKLGEINVGV